MAASGIYRQEEAKTTYFYGLELETSLSTPENRQCHQTQGNPKETSEPCSYLA